MPAHCGIGAQSATIVTKTFAKQRSRLGAVGAGLHGFNQRPTKLQRNSMMISSTLLVPQQRQITFATIAIDCCCRWRSTSSFPWGSEWAAVRVQSPGDETVPEGDVSRRRPSAHRYPGSRLRSTESRGSATAAVAAVIPKIAPNSSNKRLASILGFSFKRRSRAADRSGDPCNAGAERSTFALRTARWS